MRSVFYLLLFTAFILLNAIVTFGYYYDYFAGDGFIYFNALRNFVRGKELWAGPGVGYLLGHHGYFTLILWAPLVWIFSTPLVFLYTATTLWLFSTAVFFEIVRHAFKRFAIPESPLLIAIGIFFASYPIMVQFGSHTWHLFQPDYLLVPTLLLLFYSLQRKSFLLLYSVSFFILGTKEEFVIFFPAFLAWCFIPYRVIYGTWPLVSAILTRYCIFCGVTGAVFLALFCYFRTWNPVDVGIKQEFDIASLTKPWILERSLYHLSVIFLPLLSLLIYQITRQFRRGIALLALLLVFYVGREILNIGIYTWSPNPFYHTRAVIIPVLLVSVVLGLVPLLKKACAPKSLWLVLGLSIFLNLYLLVKLQADPVMIVNDFIRHKETYRNRKIELDALSEKIPEAFHSQTNIVLSPELARRFSGEKNFISLVRLLRFSAYFLKEFQYGIVPRNSVTEEGLKNEPGAYDLFWKNFRSVDGTRNYLIVEKVPTF